MGRISHHTNAPRGHVAGTTYASVHEFEQSVGRPTVQKQRTRVITVTGAGADLIRPLPERQAVRYGLSIELTALDVVGSSSAIRRFFLCHPEDAAFDSMELSVTGTTERTDDLPWLARAQLVQLRKDQYWQISGELKVKDKGEDIFRTFTVIPLDSTESKVELEGGFIERPWALFVECQLNSVIPLSTLPTWAENARLQVTVNLIARQGGW